MRVLLAVDGSSCSEAAVDHVMRRLRERARRLVDGVASRLELKGFRTSVSCPDADPRHAVVEAAAAWPADLIVVGSHGRRGVDRFLLGSVAESVVRHSPCSVEVVRRQVAA